MEVSLRLRLREVDIRGQGRTIGERGERCDLARVLQDIPQLRHTLRRYLMSEGWSTEIEQLLNGRTMESERATSHSGAALDRAQQQRRVGRQECLDY